MKVFFFECILLLLLCISCKNKETGALKDSVDGSTCSDVRIAWDYSSMKPLASSGSYVRMLRLLDHSLVAVYDDDEGYALIRSYDKGNTWSKPTHPFRKFLYTNKNNKHTAVNIANAEIIQLVNGDFILGCNYRPEKAEVAPYTIAICRSNDNGKTFTKPQELYHAAPRFTDGCWEPSFLQLPNGNLQVYFANENPYQKSDEQEISMLSSNDNGITWSKQVTTVSFRAHHRDGMPVARIVGNEIVVTIEDNKEDRFKPYTVRTPLSHPWQTPVLANSKEREYALQEAIDSSIYMGAPYFLVLPSGQTLISYQTTEQRTSNWELSTVEVALGDCCARHFEKRTRPFPIPADKMGLWNSVALLDSQTVVALTSSNFKSTQVCPWMIKGYIISNLTCQENSPTTYPVFIGSKGTTNLRAGVETDSLNFYIKCKVRDRTEVLAPNNSNAGDGVGIYIENRYIWCARNNSIYSNTETDSVYEYTVNVKIPKDSVQCQTKDGIRIDIELSAFDSPTKGYIEGVANCDRNRKEGWLKVELRK